MTPDLPLGGDQCHLKLLPLHKSCNSLLVKLDDTLRVAVTFIMLEIWTQY